VPVRSLSHPIANDATQPEKLPIELMRAIPPAAAVPVSQRSFLTVGREFIPKKLSAQRNPMIFDVTSERTQACTCVAFDISKAPRECAFGTGRIEALV
jgi:hypothetical protein